MVRAENSVIHLFPPDDLLHPTYAPAVLYPRLQ